MARICIVTPARPGARNGNRHTAQRWAGFLRALGHRVKVMIEWDGRPCDLLLALHARRSHPSIVEYRKRFPGKPLVAVLTGTDLYRDLPRSREARASLASFLDANPAPRGPNHSHDRAEALDVRASSADDARRRVAFHL